MSEARQAILRSIRENLAASAAHDAREHDDAPRPPAAGGIPLPLAPRSAAAPPAPAGDLTPVARFRERLEAVGGRCVIVRDEAEAARAVARILAERGARRVALTSAPLVRRVAAPAPAGVELLEDAATGELFSCDAGVTTAQWGIAETGTLVLESAHERHRLASLIPPVHVALLPASRLCGSLGEALERVRGEGAEPSSRAITLITGPSRTADIELTLAIGVHGPQELHVVVLEDGS